MATVPTHRHAPGVVKSIPFGEYQRLLGCNWSTLSSMDTSPLKYHDNLSDPPEATATMQLGSAIHAAVLEPHLFDDQYTYYDGAHNGYEWESVKAGAEEAGLTVLSVAEWEQCMGAAYAVHRAPHGREARRIMGRCRRELSLVWTDPATGIRCKARPDLVRMTRERDGRLGAILLADIKTTTTVDARKFGRTAADLLYHGKMAFACRGLETIFGLPPMKVAIIAIEQKRPHDIGVFPLDPDVLYAGDQLVSKLLRQLQTCRKRRTWPGRYSEPVSLDFPAYALPSANDIGDLGFTFEVRGEQP
jgi:exodeoxyribonuclease VIII